MFIEYMGGCELGGARLPKVLDDTRDLVVGANEGSPSGRVVVFRRGLLYIPGD